MAGKPVISRVFGDEPKVPVGRQASVRQNSYPHPHVDPSLPLELFCLSLPLTCCSLDGIHRKRCFLAGKSGYIYFPTGGTREARVSLRGKQAGGTNRDRVGTRGEEKHVGQRAAWGLKEVTLAS